MIYSILVDTVVGARSFQSAANAFEVRRGVDKDLATRASMIEAEELAPYFPPWMDSDSTISADGSLVRLPPDKRGRRRDILRPTWGAHIKSEENVPGGLR